MSKVEILIVEDDPGQAADLKAFLESKGYVVKSMASDLSAALDTYLQNEFDLAIIDIYLGGSPDGITFARALDKGVKKSCPFIFLTSSMDRDIFDKAKLTNPTNYLLKPYNELELQYAIELALEKTVSESDNFAWEGNTGALFIENTFFLKKRDRLIKVKSTEIILIEVESRYCKLITHQGSFLVQSSMKALHEKLGNKIFFRTHRNYLINKNKVKEVFPADNMITMENDMTVFLGDTYREEFFKNYTILK